MRAWILVAILLLAPSSVACPPSASPRQELSRDRAVELARRHVPFQPERINAEKKSESGQAVWQVTFRRKSSSLIHLQDEVFIVTLDRASGEVSSIARN